METQKSKGFLLRMPHSTHKAAVGMAEREGISLNHFISLAVSEKLLRDGYRRQERREIDEAMRPLSAVTRRH